MEIVIIKEKFKNLRTRSDIASILGMSDKSLRFFLYGRNADKVYHEFAISKKNGGVRKINAPDKSLKMIQRKLADILNCVYRVKPAAHGFVLNKNVITNANKHKQRMYVLNIDLETFFGQIHFGRIQGMLMKPPYQLGREAAITISQLVCHKGILPQGAPTSPIISNMICSPLDTELTRLAKKYKLNYSRYADDITFSSLRKRLPQEVFFQKEKIAYVGNELEAIFKKHSFPINYKKVRMFDYRKRQMVTGLVVNKFVNLPREYLKEIRAILHDCEKSGILNAARRYAIKGKCKSTYILSIIDNDSHKDELEKWFLNVLRGKIEYIKNVRGADNLIFLKYAKNVNKVWRQSVFDNVDEHLEFLKKIEKSVLILEANNKYVPLQGSGFLVKDKGLFTNHHVIENEDFYSVKTYKGEKIATISTDCFYEFGCPKIDYALFNVMKNNEYGWDIGDSDDLAPGDKLIVIGYPNYIEGNTPDIQNARFTSQRMWMGQKLYTIDKRIVHGSSGGIVLREKDQKVVGIIRSGAATLDETESSELQGFIPINEVMKDII